MLSIGLAGNLPEFTIDPDALKPAAAYVARVIRQNYPNLDVSLHARWRHFTLDGRDLWTEIASKTRWPNPEARARAAFDLAIVSVLLDAGRRRGLDIPRRRDRLRGRPLGRTCARELADVRGGAPFRATRLIRSAPMPAHCPASLWRNSRPDFTVGPDNPLAGLEGRADLLSRLGKTIAAAPAVFALADRARPGGVFDALALDVSDNVISAPDILRKLLLHLGPIWPGRVLLGGISLGDTWKHPAIKRADATDGLVPFHKLSQWLSYSLIEPLQDAGKNVTDVNGLTGLAEYRNGGLLVDANVIVLRDPAKASQPNAVDSSLVVEWRALTLALLDRVAPLVRAELGVDEDKFPLGCVLEGGTWAAGRLLAREKRADAGPPIRVVSDGTVF
jgi:hypothetical protein